MMLSLSFDPPLALKSGGILLLLLLAGLLLKAQRVAAADYRHTEVWSLLDRNKRPDERVAGRLVVGALRDACFWFARSEEHTSELQSLMRISYAVFCLKKNNNNKVTNYYDTRTT